jgi:hypothetical protein
MKRQKNLANRIRGWLPSTPTLPRSQKTTIALQNIKALANPLPPLLENKFQRSVGILIGFGIGLLLIGFGGASMAYQTTLKFKEF